MDSVKLREILVEVAQGGAKVLADPEVFECAVNSGHEDIMSALKRVPGVVTDDMGLRYLTQISVSRAMRWHPGGLEEWSLSDWGVALAGEMGELCDVIKKLNRDLDGAIGNKKTREQLLRDLADEAHDVLAYLVLLCARAEIDLVGASVCKFNQVSERNGFPERLTAALSSRTEEERVSESDLLDAITTAEFGASTSAIRERIREVFRARSLTNGGE